MSFWAKQNEEILIGFEFFRKNSEDPVAWKTIFDYPHDTIKHFYGREDKKGEGLFFHTIRLKWNPILSRIFRCSPLVGQNL